MEIKEYMRPSYTCIVKHICDESGEYYHASVRELAGCRSTGETPEEAMNGLREAMEGWLETRIENGFPVPEPIDAERLS